MAENMQPGDRLPQEKELMELLGVSRGTTREALKALEVQGIIRVSTGRSGGAVVAEVGYETAAGLLGNYFYFKKLQAAEIYQLRQLLEPEMAASAVGRLTDVDFGRLEQLIESCARVDDSPESRRKQRLEELEFHNVIARRSPNPLYSFTCQFVNKMLADQVVFKRMYLKRQQKIDRENYTAHIELLVAYRAHDRNRVRRAMTRHMRECACHIVELEAIVEKRFFSDAPVPRLQDFHR
jgi:DNA-binding FadR family transcriptional regulator